ncbi:hypothetical protein F2Q68_00043540 [Brassica cretica]|uniref:Uncharacterized protein n=1 Tax=Brassica cretica TaxID=69181 RepID=A0A8S9LJ55_BRACR|nr:hypothetical protein F2Q68_00043540 [Brassica cretica]
MPMTIRVGFIPANRSLLLKARSQQTRWNRSSHELAPRAFFLTQTNSKPTVSCSATGPAENVTKTRLSDTFRKRIEPIKEKIPKHVLEVIEEELANLDRKEYGLGSTSSIYSYLDWLTALPWGKCRMHTLHFAPGVLQANMEKLVSGDRFWSELVKVHFPTSDHLYFDICHGNHEDSNN